MATASKRPVTKENLNQENNTRSLRTRKTVKVSSSESDNSLDRDQTSQPLSSKKFTTQADNKQGAYNDDVAMKVSPRAKMTREEP